MTSLILSEHITSSVLRADILSHALLMLIKHSPSVATQYERYKQYGLRTDVIEFGQEPTMGSRQKKPMAEGIVA